MNDPGLNSLLKWSIENSEVSRTDDSAGADPTTARDPSRGLDREALNRLLGGPSDADQMVDAMRAIKSPDVDLDNKLIAFDNLEQLIENIDNANNMENLGLWTPLVELLGHPESELQRMSAWCIGTAVQNNVKAQERCLVVGAIPKLANLAVNASTATLQKKAIFALSSEVRNYQPGLDELVQSLPAEYRGEDKLDAADMEAVDVVINRLRDSVSQST